MFSDSSGNSITQIKNEDGSVKYVTSDGSELDVTETIGENGETQFTYIDGEGNEQILTRQITKSEYGSDIAEIEEEMNSLINDIRDGKFPLGRKSVENNSDNQSESAEGGELAVSGENSNEESVDNSTGIGIQEHVDDEISTEDYKIKEEDS